MSLYNVIYITIKSLYYVQPYHSRAHYIHHYMMWIYRVWYSHYITPYISMIYSDIYNVHDGDVYNYTTWYISLYHTLNILVHKRGEGGDRKKRRTWCTPSEEWELGVEGLKIVKRLVCVEVWAVKNFCSGVKDCACLCVWERGGGKRVFVCMWKRKRETSKIARACVCVYICVCVCVYIYICI